MLRDSSDYYADVVIDEALCYTGAADVGAAVSGTSDVELCIGSEAESADLDAWW